jgi:predicted transcriptional regulator of viral defense system
VGCPLKFFGGVEVKADGSQVKMAEPEKTILDFLDRPAYAGGDACAGQGPNQLETVG